MAIVLPAPSLTVIVSPGVPVPDSVGVVSLVLLSPVTPASLAGSRTAAGAAGAVVSIVNASVAAGPVLPAGSVALIESVLRPSGSAVAGVADQVPSG